MKCSRCEHENVTGETFCGNCGSRLAAACPACGAAHVPGQKFCGTCGAALRQGDGRKYAAPETYTPKHLAEKILTSKRALEGERKQVTVLFADMKGSMELLAGRDPEEARRILDPVLELMMDAVHRYEGMVNQVMGDGIMALFGAPVAHEDHAVRACYAALQMQEAARRYGDEVRRLYASEVQLRVGLNSGDVVVRSMGSDLRMDYTAIGQTTHLAARMEQLARPGTICLTADTFKLAQGYIEVQPLGPMPIKGLGESVEVYEIVGAGSIRRRFEAAALRGLTRFVGREAELDHLAKALRLAGHGHGRIVAVVGEPGIGKSRLFHEFTRAPRTQGWLVLESGPASYVTATPYLPVIDLLREYFQIEAADDSGKIHEKVTGKLLALDRALEPLLSPILALLDGPVDDAAWDALDPFQRRHRTIDAVKQLLVDASRGQPLMLVVEDLHWVDAETQAVLDALVEGMPAARILLLVNYRPEYRLRWAGKSYCTERRIDPLPAEDAEALLATLLGRGSELHDVTKLLTGLTEGNPFFLEESVRMLIDTRVLVREDQRYHLARPSATIKVPATVQAVLVARIDRLPETDKQLLQTAAVIGRHVPRPLLQQVAELPGDVVHESLARLKTAEFLYEAKVFPHVEYVFKHALTHEVAYGTLLQARRRALHVAITEALEGLPAERLGEQVEVLAHHALAGQLWEKAVPYLRRAGIKAASRSANRDAVQRFEQALMVLERLPETRQHLEWAMDLRIRLGNCFWTLGEFIPMHEHVRSAETLAVALGDQRRLGQISASRSHCGWLLGEVTRAMEDGRRAMTIAEQLGDLALRVRATYFVAQSWEALGQYREAAELQRTIIELLREQSPHNRFGMAGVPAVWCRFSLVWCLAELGAVAEAETHATEAGRIADVVDDALGRLGALLAEGFVALRAGRLTQTADVGERALALCRSAKLVVLVPLAAFLLGSASTLTGHASAAVGTLNQAVRHAASMNFLVYQPLLLSALSGALLEAGRPDDARHQAHDALRLARERGERGYEAGALRQLAEVAARQHPAERAEAERLYREALTVAEELGMRPLAAQCRLGLGRLARARADQSEAARHLTDAARMFADMDASLWFEQAQRELRESS